MSEEPEPRTVAWYVRPSVVLPAFALLLLLSALLVQQPANARDGDPRLTTESTEPMGARLLYQLAGRTGWRVSRHRSADIAFGPEDVFAVLDPVVPLTQREVHDLLERVRAGGALLTALGDGTDALSDSIGIDVDSRGTLVAREVGSLHACTSHRSPSPFATQGLWIGLPSLYGLKGSGLTSRARTFVSAEGYGRDSSNVSRPAVVGITFGHGKIVVASDPDVFRNDALRECTYGFDVALQQELRYLRGDRPELHTAMLFDEYHQGRGAMSGTMAVIRSYMRNTPSGHTVLQLCVAGLVLLVAFATRVLPPRGEERVERRSPLEHVDALARAYAAVDATRTGALRLVRGLRRRVDRSATAARTEDEDLQFLARIADTKPLLAADVALVRNAMQHTVTAPEFAHAGEALARIEASLTSRT